MNSTVNTLYKVFFTFAFRTSHHFKQLFKIFNAKICDVSCEFKFKLRFVIFFNWKAVLNRNIYL